MMYKDILVEHKLVNFDGAYYKIAPNIRLCFIVD